MGVTMAIEGIPEDIDADSALVAAAQQDPDAFEALYVRYSLPIHRYCQRRIGDPELAADAVAAIFARVWAALPKYRDRSFRAWLFRIAHNEVADHYRRTGRRPQAPLEAAASLPAPGPTLEEISEGAERRAEIDRLLARLPETQRRVIELRLAGLDGAEIAFALGRSRESVKMLQFRAARNLRSWRVELDDTEDSYGR